MSVASSLAKLGSGVGYIYLTDTSDVIQRQFLNSKEGHEDAKRFMLTSYTTTSNVSAFSTVNITAAGGTITNLSYNGVSVFDVASPITGATTADLATNLALAINGHLSVPEYTAVASGSSVIVYLDALEGSSLNGTAAASSVTGTVAITASTLDGGTYPTDIVDSQIGFKMYLNASVTAPLGSLVGATDVTIGVLLKSASTPASIRSSEISAGSLSIDRDSFITIVNVQTEGAVAADDLISIAAGIFSSGDIIVLRGEDAAKITTVKEGGNIQLSNNSDFDTGEKDSVLMLQYDNNVSPTWYEISRSPGNVISVPSFRSAGIPQPVSGVEVSAINLSGVSETITAGTDKGYWALTGSGTLTGSVSYNLAAGVVEGDKISIRMSGGIDLGGFSFIVGGVSLTQSQATYGVVVENVWEGSSWIPTIYPFGNRDLVDEIQLATKEDELGNPADNGYVLTSTVGGVRTWEPKSDNVFEVDLNTVGNTTGLNTLWSTTIPSGFLTNGSSLEIEFTGSFAANASSKSLSVTFNDVTTILANTLTTSPNSVLYKGSVSIFNDSNTSAKTDGILNLRGLSPELEQDVIPALNFSSTSYTLEIKAVGTSPNDIVLNSVRVVKYIV